MNSPQLIDDLLLLLSAIGSCLAGAVYGWHLRSGQILERSTDSVNKTPVVSTPTNSNAPDQPAEKGMAASPYIAPVLFIDNQDAIPEHPDSFASVYGEESTGFSQTEVRNVALRLMDLATSLAADLNAHDVHVSNVNASLTTTQSPPTMESLLAVVDRLVETNEAIKSKLRDSRDRILEQASEIQSAADLANTDALTQIGNRRRFDFELAVWDGSRPGVLALMDIDHFKKFNDDYGHRAGDEVLKAVASVLRSQLHEHCTVARYGGEEFALIFSNHELEDVLELIEDAGRNIAESQTSFEGKDLRVTCSMGVTRMTAGESSEQWVERADRALYFSKDAGRNCGHCIDSVAIGKSEPAIRFDWPSKPNSTQFSQTNQEATVL